MALFAPPIPPSVTTQVGAFSQAFAATTQTVAPELTIPQAYVEKAVEACRMEVLGDGTYYAEIPGFDGVWANSATPSHTLDELRSVLIDWLALKMENGDGDIPTIGGFDLNHPRM